MTKACIKCQHYAKGHQCKKKQAPTERARIIGTDRVDCWEVKRDENKLLEVGK